LVSMAPNPAMSEYIIEAQNPVEVKLPKILLADDNEDIRVMLERLLKSLSLDVIMAEDGEQAVTLAQQEVPDLIFMDLMMPRLSGLEAARKIHEIPALHGIPIVAISAFRHPEIEAPASGTFQWHAYLSKPFDPTELESIISQVLVARGV
jgi:CheY-like chemotaxis protein